MSVRRLLTSGTILTWLAVALVGCDDAGNGGGFVPDTAFPQDTSGDTSGPGQDVQGDAPSQVDVSSDGEPLDPDADATPVTPDAEPDAGQDVPDSDEDVPGPQPDTTPDTQPDTTPDVADTQPDTTPDTQPDTAPDTQPDTAPDVADTQPDTAPDVADTQPDTAPDVADTQPDSAPDIADAQPDVPDTVDDTDAGPAECGTLALSGELIEAQGGLHVIEADLGLGSPDVPDVLQLEFYSDETGTFDLASAANDNYAYCEQCVRVLVDVDQDGNVASQLFQAAGTITVGSPPQSGPTTVTLEGVVLEEVTIESETFQSTPVPDGTCYEVPTPTTLEPPVCEPDCTGKVCGPDGCGGTCGECTSGTCAVDGSECASAGTCQQVNIAGTVSAHPEFPQAYLQDLTGQGLGATSEPDSLNLEFYAEDIGTFDLAPAPNDSYATCEQCVQVVVDAGTAYERRFFQTGGTITVNEGSDPFAGLIDTALTDVTLVEVTIDPETFETTPVSGGACMELDASNPVTTP
ncbi:MAG: hypothetical protein ACQEXJ_19395 [Myxococcota bacterium]